MRLKRIFFILTAVIITLFLAVMRNFFSFSFFAKNKNAKHFYFTNQEDGSTYAGMFFLTDESSVKNKEDAFGEMIELNESETSFSEIVSFFDAKIVWVEKLQNLKIYFLNSSLLKKNINLNGKNFNLQVIFSEDKIKICYPINFAGF